MALAGTASGRSSIVLIAKPRASLAARRTSYGRLLAPRSLGLLLLHLGRLAVGVAIDVPLLVLAHRERAIGHVALDHCTGASVGAVTDFYRCDQHRVNADADIAADRSAVLAETVVVGGDRAGAEVAAGADLGIADVGEVRHLGALADPRVLHLDEGAGLGPWSELGTGTQVGKGADLSAVADLALDQVGVRHDDVAAELGVGQGADRADRGAGADLSIAAQGGARLDPGVGGDLDVGVDPGGSGVDNGDAGKHVSLEDAAARLGLYSGEVDAVVDAHGHREVIGEVSGYRVPGLAQ